MKSINTFLFLLILLFTSCAESEDYQKRQAANKAMEEMKEHPAVGQSSGATMNLEKASITLLSFQEGKGWGYDIFINGKKTIHQPLIPGVAGNEVFASEKEALATGNLMVYKLKHRIMPPGVSKAELDSMHVNYAH